MSIPGKNADLIRRFKLYGFGFVLGIVIVSFVYKGRGCQLPGSAKLEELNYQKLELSKVGECMINCKGISPTEIKQLLKSGKVNFNDSGVHDKPYPTYAVESTTSKGQKIRMVIADVDTISVLQTIVNLQPMNDTCSCK